MSWSLPALLPLPILIVVALVTAAILYDQITKGIPSRENPEQAPRARTGLVQVARFAERRAAKGTDIVFVHGLGSNPDTTWNAKTTSSPQSRGGENVCWVTDFLPRDIPEELRANVCVYFYNYNSYWKRDAVKSRLRTFGEKLLSVLHDKLHIPGLKNQRNLIFVGHSYGGLVIKQALILARHRSTRAHIAEATKAVFFLGTPHQGSAFSKWGRWQATFLTPLGSIPDLLREVEEYSYQTEDLHSQFIVEFGDNLIIKNFYEGRGMLLVKVWFWKWASFCVTKRSATFDGKFVENIQLDVDHYGLNKFATRDNGDYMAMSDKIRKTLIETTEIRQTIYSIPQKRASKFVPRKALIQQISEKLDFRHEGGPVPNALVLHGLGGAGKTQLALNFAKTHQEMYDLILFIDAQDEQTTRGSFERCAIDLQLPFDRSTDYKYDLVNLGAVRAVTNHLQQMTQPDDSWLMIFDNADDFEWRLQDIIPEGPRGTIIVTSRDNRASQLLNEACGELEISKIEPQEATQLLLTHLKETARSASPALIKSCEVVAERLEYLVLAVDLAGAYIGLECEHGVNKEAVMQQYLVNLGRHRDELLQNDEFSGLRPSNKTVWTVWDTTLDKLAKQKSRPDLLLAFLSRFKPPVVQNELFSIASHLLPEEWANILPHLEELNSDQYEQWRHNGLAHFFPGWLIAFLQTEDSLNPVSSTWNRFHYNEALKSLARYHLVQRVEGKWEGVTMHSLVRWRATMHHQEHPWNSWFTSFMVRVSLTVYRTKSPFLQHAVLHVSGDTSGQYLKSLDEATAAEAQINYARLLVAGNRYNEALDLCDRAADAYQRIAGDDNVGMANALQVKSKVYLKLRRLEEGTELGVRVVDIRTKVFGEEDDETLLGMEGLAVFYIHQGLFKDAETLLLKVIRLRRSEDSNEARLYQSRLTLAWLHHEFDQHKTAKRHFMDILIDLETFVPEVNGHGLMAACLYGLSCTCLELHEFETVKHISEKALEAGLEVYGEEDESMARLMGNLASALHETGHRDEAIGYARRIVMAMKDREHTTEAHLWGQELLDRWTAES